MTSPTRLLHITDTHLHAQHDARLRRVNTRDTFLAVLEEAGREQWDAVLATGDLAQDETAAAYDSFCEALLPLEAPVLCLPGNHDSLRLMAEKLNTAPFRYLGASHFGNWAVILLDSVIRGETAGCLDPDDLESLDGLLRENADRHVMLAMHHQPRPMGSRWLDGVGLRNPDDLNRVLDAHTNVRCVTWGHVHQASDAEAAGIRWLSSPSTCSQFLPGQDDFRLDDRPPGFRSIELHDDGSINTEVRWVTN